jgi:hypothetical protein
MRRHAGASSGSQGLHDGDPGRPVARAAAHYRGTPRGARQRLFTSDGVAAQQEGGGRDTDPAGRGSVPQASSTTRPGVVPFVMHRSESGGGDERRIDRIRGAQWPRRHP